MSKLEGSCMCGQISYDSDAEPAMTAVCHCVDCQKQSGTAFSIVVGLPRDQLKVNGNLAIFTTRGGSGEAVNRHFWGTCGSPICSQVDAMPDILFIKAGTLEDTSWLQPQLEFWCDSAQSWLDLGGQWDKLPRNPPLG
jgi:hypothetical protein